jgi:hypothetical protein
MITPFPSNSPLYARFPVRALAVAVSLSLATLAVALAYDHAPTARRADPPVATVSAPGPQVVRGEPDASAVTTAEHALPHSMAMRATAFKSPEIVARLATAVPGHPLSTHAGPPGDTRDDELGRSSGTRECRPDAGVVRECIFD